LSAENLSAESMGQPDYQLPLVLSTAIPPNTDYIAGSAASGNTLPSGVSGFTIRYSTDNEFTWTTTEPSPAADITHIEWWLEDKLPGLATIEATFQSTIPTDYGSLVVTASSDVSVGAMGSLVEDTALVQIVGVNKICGTVYGDDGGTTGGEWNQNQDGDEIGLANVTVHLYVDVDGDGRLNLPPEIGDTTDLSEGLIGGHFDVDTYSDVTPFNTGIVDGHVHEYDDVYGKLGVDWFNVLSPYLLYSA
ncbi:MAG: hypothetical protein AAGA62_13540, partial [Bacteroidota bacterium]